MNTTVAVLVLIVLVSSILSLFWFWFGLSLFVVLLIVFISNAIQTVPANPPHKGLLVRLGKRIKVVLKEGLNFLPGFPFIFSFILIKVEKVVQDLAEHIVRTPDLAEIGAKVSLTWQPGGESDDETYEESLINYLNTGGEVGVRKNLNDIIEDRLRTWAASNQEGPSDWMEAMASKDEALEVLLKAILGDSLPRVDSDIPTTAWMKFFSEPKRRPSQNEIKMGWSANPTSSTQLWAGLQIEFEKLSLAEQTELRKQVKARMKAVREIKEGRGTFFQEALGITILRFTVNEISVKGKTAIAAEMDAKEQRETTAETREFSHVSARIQELMGDNPTMSIEQAVRIVQTERGKISQTVLEVVGASSGWTQDILAALGLQKTPGESPASGSSGKKGGKKRKMSDDELEGEWETDQNE